MVGATGFEPATSCSQSRHSTRLSYAPRTARTRAGTYEHPRGFTSRARPPPSLLRRAAFGFSGGRIRAVARLPGVVVIEANPSAVAAATVEASRGGGQQEGPARHSPRLSPLGHRRGSRPAGLLNSPDRTGRQEGAKCLDAGQFGQMAFQTQENRKIRPSVGCVKNNFLLTVVIWYDLRRPGCHLGNVVLGGGL